MNANTIFTIVVIGSFVFGMFIYFGMNKTRMHTNAPIQNVTEFSGFGEANATISDFTNYLVVSCNTSNYSVISELQKIENVTNAYLGGQSLIVVSATSPEDAKKIVPKISSVLSPFCKASVLRAAYISLENTVVLKDKKNNTLKVYPREIELSAYKMGKSGIEAFVYPFSKKGEKISVEVYGVVDSRGEEKIVKRFIAQEKQRPIELKSWEGEVKAKITKLENRGKASAKIEWKERNINTSSIKGTLNRYGNASIDYTKKDWVYIDNKLSNATKKLVKNLSWVRSLSFSNGKTRISIGNFSDESEVVKTLVNITNTTPELPRSVISVSFNTSNFSAFSDVVSSLFSNYSEVSILRKAEVSFVNASKNYTFDFPKTFEANVYPSLKVNETADLKVDVLYTLQGILSIAAAPYR